METTTCRPVHATQGPSSFGARATYFPMGGVGMERSGPWTWTAQGSAKQLGSPGDGGGRYLGKGG